MATAILNELYDLEVIRTRDDKILGELDIVYDVGGGKFDHHGIEKTFREDGIPFAACGLIWNKFGRDVIRFKNPTLSENEIESVFTHLDRMPIEGIDALDNGIIVREGEIPIMSISSIVSGFNPLWHSNKNEDESFSEAVEFLGAILRNTLNQRFAVLKARDHVIRAYEKRTIPEILVLYTYCPYREILQEIDEKGEVIFVVYPRKDSYAIQTIRGLDGEDKKQLPEAWAGKRDEELSAITGVSDALFCHTGRFIAVAKSFEGIMEMANLALQEPDRKEKGGVFRFITRLFRES